MNGYLRGETSFTVAVDEADCMGRLKPSAIMQYMQDLATSHADEIGVGFKDTFPKNLIWVQTRMSVRVSAYPRIGERITAETFPHAPGLVECGRDYYLYRADGTEFARASTFWCLLDFVSRRIRKPKDLFRYGADEYRPDEAVPDAPRKFDLPDDLAEAYTDAVRYTDTDRNRHLNNARYGDMLLDAFPDSFNDGNDIASFDVRFVKEMKPGDRYVVRSGGDGTDRYVSAQLGDETVFEARFSVRPRTEGVV